MLTKALSDKCFILKLNLWWPYLYPYFRLDQSLKGSSALVSQILPLREVKLVSVVSAGGSADAMEGGAKGKSAHVCNNLNLLPVQKSHFLPKRSLGSFVGPRGGFSLNMTRIQNPDPLKCRHVLPRYG